MPRTEALIRRTAWTLLARSIVAVVLLPGTVTVLIPFQILREAGLLLVPTLSFSSVLAALVIAAGVAVLLRCVWDFFASGRGTLAPFDPPKHLVVKGLYRYTRNPMYNGVLAVLVGEAWLFRSLDLLQFAAIMLVIFHTAIVVWEERSLVALFGTEYDAYRRAVPRWGFTRRPFERS